MKEITVSDLSALAEPMIVDVREPAEFAHGHVPAATNIPLGDVVDRLRELSPTSPVYVICASGGRSAQATEYLAASGVDAINVIGGTSAWQNARLPLER